MVVFAVIVNIILYISSSFATFSYVSGGGTTTLTVPAGSTGRKVSLYSTTGALTNSAISGDVSVVIGVITSGTYFWRITDTDGKKFLDTSDWVTITNGDTWDWSTSSLSCHVNALLKAHPNCSTSWEFEERGSAGNYYRAIKKNTTSDYVNQSLPLGTALGTNNGNVYTSGYACSFTNCSFETSNWIIWWGPSTFSMDSTNKTDGTYSQNIPWASGGQYVKTGYISGLSASTYYTIRARFRGNITGGTGYGGLRLYDNVASADKCSTFPNASGNTWTWISCTGQTGADVSQLYIAVGYNSGGTSGNVWFDSVEICQGNNVKCNDSPFNASNSDNDLRWSHNSSSGWVTVDLGSQMTINAIQILTKSVGQGYNNYTLSGSNDNSSFTQIVTGTRLQYDQSLLVTFANQSYRYVKLATTSAYGGYTELTELKVYNMSGANAFGDIDELYIQRNLSWPWEGVYRGLAYTDKNTNPDGSVTYTKTLSVSGGNFIVETTYAKLSVDTWMKQVKLTTPNTAETWSVGLRQNLVRATANAYHTVNSNNLKSMATVDYTIENASGDGSLYTPNNFQFSTLCDPQCFGIVADDGWNAKWMFVGTPFDGARPAGIIESKEVSGAHVHPVGDWKSVYVQYGKRQDGLRYVTINGNSSITLNTYYYYGADPTHEGREESANTLAYKSLAEGKGYVNLDSVDNILVASAWQNVRIRNTTEQNIQWFVSSEFYSCQTVASCGIHYTDVVFAVIAMKDQGIAERLYNNFRTCNCDISTPDTASIHWDDPLTSTPGPKLWFFNMYSLWLKNTFGTSIVLSEIRTKADIYTNAIGPSGAIWESNDFCDDTVIYSTFGNDVTMRQQMVAIMELRSAKALLPVCGAAPCWSSADEADLNAAIAYLSNFYDATNGYIHQGIYGHWRTATNASCSGGTCIKSTDYVQPATARFVASATGTLTVYGSKKDSYGEMVVRKNGTLVGTYDLYNATPLYQQAVTNFSVSINDVVTIYPASTKNASSSAYYIDIDKITIDANTYEQDNSNFVCLSTEFICENGYTVGYKTWNEQAYLWIFELLYRLVLPAEHLFSNEQLNAHFQRQWIGDLSDGGFGSHIFMRNMDAFNQLYHDNVYNGFFRKLGVHNGGDWFSNTMPGLRLQFQYTGSEYLGVYYRFQEESALITYTGTWDKSNRIGSTTDADYNYPDSRRYRYTTTLDNTVTIPFYGTEIQWIASKGPAIITMLDDMNTDTWSESEITGGSFNERYLGTVAPDTTNPFLYKDVTDFSGINNVISIKYKGYKGGPTGLRVYFRENVDCATWSGTCMQDFTGMLSQNDEWQSITLAITDPEWLSSDTIDQLRIDLLPLGSVSAGTFQIDYMGVGRNSGSADVHFCSGVGCTPTLDTAGISLSNATPQYQQSVYTKSNLPYGKHTLKIVSKTTAPVSIDAFKIKTKPSWLVSLRKNLEVNKSVGSHEFLTTWTEYGSYGDTDMSAGIYKKILDLSQNVYYGLVFLRPQWRGIFEGIYHRRVAQ
mgnify:FL=1